MIDSAYLSPNAKYVYFNEGGSLYSIKINGQAKKKLAVDRKIVGIASDGSRLVIVGENVGYDKLKYFELYDFKYGGVIKKIHVDNPLVINCSYPNGFSCYY